jgi:subtilase family serine protease
MIREVVSSTTKGAKPFRVGPAGTIGPAGGLTPGDLSTAYNLKTTGGAGQTVAIVDAYNDPNIASDLATFDTQYGQPACTAGNGCLKVVNQTGGSTPPANDESGWSVEESLDVETVHSVCHGCKIILVEATTNGNSDLAAAEDKAVSLGANEVTNSFGEPEGNSDSIFAAAFNHPKVVITASAGDDGYYDFDQLDRVNEPSIPAAYNTVVSVGGTSLNLNQSGSRQSETVWNDNGQRDYNERLSGESLGAGGGGCSTLFSAQKWQTSLSTWSSTGCGTKRLDNDVAAVADYLTGFDVYDSYSCDNGCDTGWYTVGGTSLSSPLIASAWALAGGAHGVTYPALTVYGHRNLAYDVTTGGNGWCDGQGASECGNPNTLGDGLVDCDYTATGTVNAGDRACDALPGYDGPTGVGTPNGDTMFTKTGPSAAIAEPTSVTHGTSERWKVAATDPFPGGTIVHYVWNWGDGTTSTTTTNSATHTYKTYGVTRTITVTVTDNYGATGSATHKVKVNK